MRRATLAVATAWFVTQSIACAAELPSRRQASQTKTPIARTCEIDGEPGVPLASGGCVRIGGYVSVGVTAGSLKPH